MSTRQCYASYATLASLPTTKLREAPVKGRVRGRRDAKVCQGGHRAGQGVPSLAAASHSDASSSDLLIVTCASSDLAQAATLRNHALKHHGEDGVPDVAVASV